MEMDIKGNPCGQSNQSSLFSIHGCGDRNGLATSVSMFSSFFTTFRVIYIRLYSIVITTMAISSRLFSSFSLPILSIVLVIINYTHIGYREVCLRTSYVYLENLSSFSKVYCAPKSPEIFWALPHFLIFTCICTYTRRVSNELGVEERKKISVRKTLLT